MPPPTIADRVRQALGIDLGDLSGGSLAGEIPLTDGFVNHLVAERLVASQGPVTAAQIETHEGEQLTVQLSLRAPRLMSSVRIAVRIDQQPECPGRPVLGLRWSLPGMGPLALFAAPALAYFKALPQGMDAAPGSPEELGAYIRAEQQKWSRVVREAGIVAQ